MLSTQRVKSFAYGVNNRIRIENSIKTVTTFERVSKIYLLNHWSFAPTWKKIEMKIKYMFSDRWRNADRFRHVVKPRMTG